MDMAMLHKGFLEAMMIQFSSSKTSQMSLGGRSTEIKYL
jgi:hypothetical protein